MTNAISRRRMLSGIGAMTTLPLIPLHAATATGPPEVVIVGAGIAGITAAQELAKAGISFTVLEARNRIGGRAYTESQTFGVPYDHGCAWLHSADKNPLMPLIKGVGFATVDEGAADTWFYSDGEELDDDEYEDASDAVESLEDRVGDYNVKENGDKSVRDIAPPKGEWGRFAHLVMGEYEAGVGTDELSVEDVQSQYGTGVEWMVPQGMATGIFKALGPVPVQLNTIVTRIAWGGPGVIVETNKGTLNAAAALITVPTDIIADGTIVFEPALPDWKMDAYQACPMGVLDKITLQFSSSFNEFFEEASTTSVYIEHQGVWRDHLLRPFDLPLDVAFTGGRQSRDLAREADPQAAAIDLALSALTDTFGFEIKRMFVKGHFTNWSADPFARGAYAYARVGKNHLRRKIATPVDDRLFFAGEACVPEWATQAPAAYISGRTAANQAARAVG
jgi:monoamine oxidase